MRYPGGKNGAGTYQRIVNQIPPHHRYVEAFVGSGAVLRLKRAAEESYALDLDPGALDTIRDVVPDGTRLIQADAFQWLGDRLMGDPRGAIARNGELGRAGCSTAGNVGWAHSTDSARDDRGSTHGGNSDVAGHIDGNSERGLHRRISRDRQPRPPPETSRRTCSAHSAMLEPGARIDGKGDDILGSPSRWFANSLKKLSEIRSWCYRMKPPRVWKTVKQPVGSLICTAAVTAMAIGRSLRYVRTRMEPSRHPDGRVFYRVREMLKVLGGHGIYCGMIAEADGTMSKEEELLFASPMIDRPAILTVPSPGIVGAFHVVFWDGNVVRDPLPNVPAEMALEAYTLKEIMPLIYIDESLESFRKLQRAEVAKGNRQ